MACEIEINANTLLYLKYDQVFNKTKTITILDWDDTLFPTTLVSSNMNWIDDPKSMPDKIKLEFEILSVQIIYLITAAKTFGDVVIISNAAKEWLISSVILIPNVVEILRTVEIISTREYCQITSDDPQQWKTNTFFKKIGYYCESNPNTILNVVCIGDSIIEYEAIKSVEKYINNGDINNIVYRKNIKFIDKPSIKSIIKQIFELAELMRKSPDKITCYGNWNGNWKNKN
jgi:hypothetical protein